MSPSDIEIIAQLISGSNWSYAVYVDSSVANSG
jgi:hypothetical protein